MNTSAAISTYEQSALDFLAKYSVSFKATLSNTKQARWTPSGHHYVVTLGKKAHGRSYDNQAKRLTFDFWSSLADKQTGITTVSPYSVLACVSGDASCPETFEDFCAEFGYESDSIAAHKTFRSCLSFSKRIQAFFSKRELADLAEIN